MLVFVVTILLVFKHPVVRIPFTRRRLHINYAMAPPMGVLFLLAINAIDGEIISRGIFESNMITPYAIIILIMTLAYITVSLDYTGLFEYVSLRFAKMAKGSGKKLFIYFFVLSSFLTLVTDSDIVILTMTPIIFYFSRRAKVNPLPFLITQFFAANILSITLYIGAPANIIAADAQGIGFLEFLKWMLLPSIVAVVACLCLLILVFWKVLPTNIKMPDVNPRLAIKNMNGAIFGTAVFVATIILMSLPTDLTGLPMWAITSIGAGILFLYDAIYYNFISRKKAGTHKSNVFTICSRMPWGVIPFVIGLFIIIESLVSTGWTDFFATHLTVISGNPITAVLGVIFLSSIVANFMSNQPMTIFFVRIFQSSSFSVSAVTKLGSTLALVAGASFGANMTLVGALAGVMWVNILSEKGFQISFSQFSKYGFIIMPVVILATGLTLVLELMFWT